ncbi:hypothetical protein ACQKJZ_18980 [Sphingomonas sp. NPDC019816]|uniref:hypothetical protein n=1 Tax=Sphingomonas sp. NPDC019816 TaxID=3390679 RepID=UPI003D05E7C3
MTSTIFARAGLVGLVVATGTAAIAQQAATPAAKPSAQQQYDAATALDQGTDANAALAAWTAFTARFEPGTRTWAIGTVRKGGALYRLARLDEAAKTIRTGLAALPAKDATLSGDRFNAHVMLGKIAADSLDYADATAEYGKAEAAATDDATRVAALLAGARVQTFTDPAAALAALDRADAIAARMNLGKTDQAALAQARLRLYLNTGHFAEANKMAPRVVSLLGGLTLSKVDLRDVAARSDAAMAALLSHDEDKAREYMAYTGAGRSAKGNFVAASLMTPPECGGEANLKPDDVAVIQFGVGDDGTTFGVEPVYSSGGGEKALAFARAVRGWVWTPDDMKTLPPFFRYSVRLEMRCSTSFARPSIWQEFDGAFDDWLKAKGVARAGSDVAARGGGGAVLDAQRAAMNAAAGQAPAMLAAIDTLSRNPVVGMEERQALLTKADTLIAAQPDMPALAKLRFAIATRSLRRREVWRDRDYAALMSPLLTEKPYVDDVQARNALRLVIADAIPWKDSDPYLQQVVDDAALPARDPLKVGALIRLASIAQRRGNSELARQTFEKTGLAASQCATLDAKPKPVFLNNGSSSFPQEAQRWGFEGWVRNQYDIDAAGRAQNIRTLVSYPPFIFSTASEKMMQGARFDKSYRPDGGLGCGASVTGVCFQLPG